jgi:hypothetical protein
MRIAFLITLTFLYFCMFSLYSQKLVRFREVSNLDFNLTGDNSKILNYQCLVTFPYKGSDYVAGATDNLFGISVETQQRIQICKNDPDCRFMIISKDYASNPIFKSIKLFYRDHNKINSKKIKESSIGIDITDLGLCINFSSLKSDSTIIIDIIYLYEIKSKKELSFRHDPKREYKEFNLQMEIPKIYKYNLTYDDKCLIKSEERESQASFIGWDYPSNFHGLVSNYSAKKFWNIDSQYSSLFRAYLKINSFSFKSKENCLSNFNNSVPKIIDLILDEINEIKMDSR